MHITDQVTTRHNPLDPSYHSRPRYGCPTIQASFRSGAGLWSLALMRGSALFLPAGNLTIEAALVHVIAVARQRLGLLLDLGGDVAHLLKGGDGTALVGDDADGD